MLLCLFGMAGKWSCHTIRSGGQDEAYRDLLEMQLYSLPVLHRLLKPGLLSFSHLAFITLVSNKVCQQVLVFSSRGMHLVFKKQYRLFSQAYLLHINFEHKN